MDNNTINAIKQLIKESTKWVVLSNEISIFLLVISFVILVVAIFLFYKAIKISSALNMNIETVSNNIADNNKLASSYAQHYESIKNSANVLLNAHIKTEQAIKEITELVDIIKTEAGSMRHETKEQVKNIEIFFNDFNKNLSLLLDKVSTIVSQKLSEKMDIASKESIEIKRNIQVLFNNHMTDIRKEIIKSAKINQEVTFNKATDVIAMAIKDSTFRNTKSFVDALNETFFRYKKVTELFFSMIKDISKENDNILRFVNEKEIEANKIITKQIEEYNERQKSLEAINAILDEHGFNSVLEANSEIDNLFSSENNTIEKFNNIEDFKFERV